MYNDGYGMLEDMVFANMWFNIVSSNGSNLADENRDTVATRMTSSQIEKLQDLARECVKKNYNCCK